MSILKSTGSGIKAPLTIKFLLSIGFERHIRTGLFRGEGKERIVLSIDESLDNTIIGTLFRLEPPPKAGYQISIDNSKPELRYEIPLYTIEDFKLYEKCKSGDLDIGENLDILERLICNNGAKIHRQKRYYWQDSK